MIRSPGILLILMFCCVLSSSCGYSFGPAAGKRDTIVVGMFANATREPLLEKDLTNLVISELMRSPAFTPIEKMDVSQLSLEGELVRYRSSAVAYNSSDAITRYLVTVAAEVTLREEPSGRVVWKGQTEAAQEYPANSDKAVQRQLEEQARLAALERLAEEIIRHLEHRF